MDWKKFLISVATVTVGVAIYHHVVAKIFPSNAV